MEWRRALRNKTPIALIFVDLDCFKNYNDHYGHLAGDDCLRAIARVLALGGQRATDITARFGGEEFVVLLPSTSPRGALEIAKRLRHEVMELALPHVGTPTGIVTVSLGVACQAPSHRHASSALLQEADCALYRAKQSGRNCVRSDFD